MTNPLSIRKFRALNHSRPNKTKPIFQVNGYIVWQKRVKMLINTIYFSIRQHQYNGFVGPGTEISQDLAWVKKCSRVFDE